MKLTEQFEWLLVANRLKKNFVKEYKFHPKRRWRFDYADPKKKIAIEIHGGIWRGGRHTRGKGFANDREKMNEAIVLGWRVIELCTPEQVKDFPRIYRELQ